MRTPALHDLKPANAGFSTQPTPCTWLLDGGVPDACRHRVFQVSQQRGQGDALRAVGLLRQARCIDLTDSLALGAVQLSVDLKLSPANSIIFRTARQYGAQLWTQDAHFEGLSGVNYIRKGAVP